MAKRSDSFGFFVLVCLMQKFLSPNVFIRLYALSPNVFFQRFLLQSTVTGAAHSYRAIRRRSLGKGNSCDD